MSSSTPEQNDGAGSGSESGSETGKPVGVRSSVTVAAPVSKVWEHLISPSGTAALLGPGAVLGSKGESWHSTDGPHGVVRSYHPLEQIRVSWHADEDAPPTVVDLSLAPDGDGTRLDLSHNTDSPDLQGHWDQALGRAVADLSH